MEKHFCSLPCRECSEVQKTCCHDVRLPMTEAEIKRIISKGYAAEDFLKPGRYEKSEVFDQAYEPWWIDSFLKIDGAYYRINVKKKEDGHCVFLEKGKGCTLGTDRPALCKLYPFSFDPSGIIIFEDEEGDCMLRKAGMKAADAVRLFGETEESLFSYYTNVMRECIENRDFHEKMVHRLLGSKAGRDPGLAAASDRPAIA